MKMLNAEHAEASHATLRKKNARFVYSRETTSQHHLNPELVTLRNAGCGASGKFDEAIELAVDAEDGKQSRALQREVKSI